MTIDILGKPCEIDGRARRLSLHLPDGWYHVMGKTDGSDFLPTPVCKVCSAKRTSARRKLRIEYVGAIYHVMNRGDRREPIFKNDQDRRRFVETLGETCAKTAWQVHVYCFMANHFHIALRLRRETVIALAWMANRLNLDRSHTRNCFCLTALPWAKFVSEYLVEPRRRAMIQIEKEFAMKAVPRLTTFAALVCGVFFAGVSDVRGQVFSLA